MSIKAHIRKRPWIIIVVVQFLFVAWWLSFVVWASQHTPADVPAKPAASHGRH
jgi:hypothetical protein